MDAVGSVVLAVFAHPDDESLACGGTLARLAQEGAHVVVVCASHGERGSHNGPAKDSGLGCERAHEMREAARALGIAEVHLWSHPDGDLCWAEVGLFNAELVLMLRRRRPAAVITFGEDGLYWHPDHIGVHERTLTAVRSLGADAPPLYYVSMPHGAMSAVVDSARARGWTPPVRGFWSLDPNTFGLYAAPHTIALDVKSQVSQKRAAIAAHRSQMGENGSLSQMSAADAERWLGAEYFRRAATGGAATGGAATGLLEQLCTPIS